MKNIATFSLAIAVSFALADSALAKPDSADLARISDASIWKLSHATAELVQVDGMSAVRMRAAGDSGRTRQAGLALAQGVEFSAGVLELDLKGTNQRPCFLGVVFNVTDEKNFEGIYFRPFNFKAEGVFHQRAVQYIAWPVHTWEELRTNQPGKFEKAAEPEVEPNGWFHARIEVTDKLVRVFVNGAKEPCLTADRLAEARAKRPVGLFVDVAQGLFANLEIKPDKL